MDIVQYKSQMEKSVKHFEGDLAGMQVGRASTGLVEKINVYIPTYGMSQPMNQIGNISIIDAQTLKIEPWDKSNVSSIEKAVYDANIGLTPQNMGEHVLISIPPLTKERRIELTKIVSRMGEDAKISIRNIRQDANKAIKGEFDNKEISEDEKKGFESDINDMVKDINVKIDSMVKSKSEEVKTI